MVGFNGPSQVHRMVRFNWPCPVNRMVCFSERRALSPSQWACKLPSPYTACSPAVLTAASTLCLSTWTVPPKVCSSQQMRPTLLSVQELCKGEWSLWHTPPLSQNMHARPHTLEKTSDVKWDGDVCVFWSPWNGPYQVVVFSEMWVRLKCDPFSPCLWSGQWGWRW